MNWAGPKTEPEARHPARRGRRSPFRLIIAPMDGFASPPRQDLHLRLHCVNIFVRDQDRSLRFYLDQLGFHLALDARLQSGDRWVAVAPPDGSAILSLVVPKPNSQEYKLIGRSTQVVFVTEDVASKFQEWSRRGVRFQSTPRLRRIKYDHKAQAAPSDVSSMLLGEGAPIWGGVFARFRDIDGNTFSLVSFDEVTHALEAQRGAIALRELRPSRCSTSPERQHSGAARIHCDRAGGLQGMGLHDWRVPAPRRRHASAVHRWHNRILRRGGGGIRRTAPD